MSKSFKIKSNFGPSGDQPQAIQKISKGLASIPFSKIKG